MPDDRLVCPLLSSVLRRLQRPGGDLLFRRLSGSTIGAEGFHGRVRDGIGCLAPRYGHQAGDTPGWGGMRVVRCAGEVSARLRARVLALHAGGCRRNRVAPAIKPIERLVPVSCAGCPASTSGLSTWWSTTALKRDLVLRRVSRLDAFSGYPVRT